MTFLRLIAFEYMFDRYILNFPLPLTNQMPEFGWSCIIWPKQPIQSLYFGKQFKIYLSNVYSKAIKQRRVIFNFLWFLLCIFCQFLIRIFLQLKASLRHGTSSKYSSHLFYIPIQIMFLSNGNFFSYLSSLARRWSFVRISILWSSGKTLSALT